jgi:hypothetical protein
MAKNKEDLSSADNSSIDIFIEEVLSEDKQTSIKSILKIPYTDKNTSKALRIFDAGNGQMFYASTRIKDSLINNETGYEVEVTNIAKSLPGKRYELSEANAKKIVLQGKISVKNAASNVVNITKTGTDNAK